MKLHLPKLLLTAVLAVCAAPVASGLVIDRNTNTATEGSDWSMTFNADTTDYYQSTIKVIASTSDTQVIGNAGQLFLQTWSTDGCSEDILIDGDIYVGKENGIRVGMDSYNVGLKNIYITNDSSIYENADNQSHTVSITGTVTDKVPTSVAGETYDSTSKFTFNSAKYNINGTEDSYAKVDVNELVIADNAKVTFGTYSTLVLNSTLDNKATLTINGTVEVNDLSNFDSYFDSFSSATENGFITADVVYKFIKGNALTADSTTTKVSYNGVEYNIAEGYREAGASTNDVFAVVDKDATVIVGGTSATAGTADAELFYVNGGKLNIAEGSINSSDIKYVAGSVDLSSASSTLVMDTDANDLLSAATGAGNIELTKNVTLGAGSSTKLTGDIIVKSGVNLQLGGPWDGSSAADGTTVNIAGGIEVKGGGQLSFCGDTTTLNSIKTVATTGSNAVSKLYVRDMYGSNGKADGTLTIKSLDVKNTTTYQSLWKSKVVIESLTGDSELQILAHPSEGGDKQVLTINTTSTYTGHLNLDGGADMTFNLNIAKDATTKIKTDNSSTIDKLTLAAGSTLRYNTKKWVENAQFEYTLKEVEVGGTNTAIKLDAEGDYWQGCVYIDKLTNAKDQEGEVITGSITLSGNAKSGNRDVMYLKGGDFEGTITYKGATNSGTDRKHALNITSTDAAAKAVIKLEADSGNVVALGLATNEVKVKGLEGTTGTIYSGEQAHMKDNGQGQQVWNGDAFAADGTTRKLTIKTDGNNYATSAAIVGKLNISKSGSGKQTFSGNISGWSGNIDVTGGELVMGSDVELAELSVTGGTMTVGTYTEGVLTDEGSLTVTSKATFGAGAVVNADLVLSNGATVKLAEALTMGSTVTLGEGMTLDGDLLTSVTGLTAGKKVNLFTGVEGLTLGSASYDTNSILELGTEQLGTYFANVTNTDIYLGYDGQNVYAGVMPETPVTPAVPEPTTATLSLLALAALASRRRRK